MTVQAHADTQYAMSSLGTAADNGEESEREVSQQLLLNKLLLRAADSL
jgi:hypothetical protein